MLDVTIVYPEGRPTFGDYLCGRVTSVVVDVREREIPVEMLRGDYAEDEAFRARFQQWVGALWEEKDRQLSSLLGDPASRPARRLRSTATSPTQCGRERRLPDRDVSASASLRGVHGATRLRARCTERSSKSWPKARPRTSAIVSAA